MSDSSQDSSFSGAAPDHSSYQSDLHRGKPGTPDADERNSAMLAHLLGIFLGIFGPLIIYLIKKDDSPFVEDQGKEAINFQITLIIAYAASSALWALLTFVTCGFGALLPLPLAVTVWQVTLGIVACMAANKGETYRYPANIRVIT